MTSFLVEKGATVINTFWLEIIYMQTLPRKFCTKCHRWILLRGFLQILRLQYLTDMEAGELWKLPDGCYVGLDRIGAPEVWNTGFKVLGVRVYVIDTGVDVNHPDIAGKIWTANGSILEVGGKCAGNMTLTVPSYASGTYEWRSLD